MPVTVTIDKREVSWLAPRPYRAPFSIGLRFDWTGVDRSRIGWIVLRFRGSRLREPGCRGAQPCVEPRPRPCGGREIAVRILGEEPPGDPSDPRLGCNLKQGAGGEAWLEYRVPYGYEGPLYLTYGGPSLPVLARGGTAHRGCAVRWSMSPARCALLAGGAWPLLRFTVACRRGVDCDKFLEGRYGYPRVTVERVLEPDGAHERFVERDPAVEDYVTREVVLDPGRVIRLEALIPLSPVDHVAVVVDRHPPFFIRDTQAGNCICPGFEQAQAKGYTVPRWVAVIPRAHFERTRILGIYSVCKGGKPPEPVKLKLIAIARSPYQLNRLRGLLRTCPPLVYDGTYKHGRPGRVSC